MINRIYKYALELKDQQTLQLPKGATLLTVQVQHGRPHLWAIVDELAEKESRIIMMYGTGGPMLYVGQYLGTFQLDDGNLVFHAFTPNYGSGGGLGLASPHHGSAPISGPRLGSGGGLVQGWGRSSGSGSADQSSPYEWIWPTDYTPPY